jgi:hypothetical protein
VGRKIDAYDGIAAKLADKLIESSGDVAVSQ